MTDEDQDQMHIAPDGERWRYTAKLRDRDAAVGTQSGEEDQGQDEDDKEHRDKRVVV